MRAVDDPSSFNWISSGRQPTPPAYAPEGVPLSCVLPIRFSRYVKILHRLDGHDDNIDRRLNPEELAVLKIPDCPSVRNLVMEKPSSGSRIYWREAAKALCVPYAPEITHAWFSRSLAPNPQCWPRYISGPDDGNLDVEECRELVSLLANVTPTQDCSFRLAEIPFVGTDQNLLFNGPLTEVEDFFVNGRFQFTPEYWWPADHQWCVCSDYDLTFTIVGGSSTLISSLLESEILECIEIGPEIRVDDLAPIP